MHARAATCCSLRIGSLKHADAVDVGWKKMDLHRRQLLCFWASVLDACGRLERFCCMPPFQFPAVSPSAAGLEPGELYGLKAPWSDTCACRTGF